MMGGVGLLAVLLFLLGGPFQGAGFNTLSKDFGAANRIAGFLLQMLTLFALIAVGGTLSNQALGIQIGGYGFVVCLVLAPLFSGIAFLGNMGKAEGGTFFLLLGGLGFLVSGLALIASTVNTLAALGLGPDLLMYIGYAALGGNILGHLMAMPAFLTQRT